MLYNKVNAESAKEQYERFDRSTVLSSRVLEFKGVDDLDVYNPSIPFELNGKTYIAGRVEKRNEEFSKVKFFEKKDNYYELVESADLTLQDPFVTKIDNEIILGGVNVTWGNGKDIETTWKTDFYKVKSPTELVYITCGPSHMKDVRLVQLNDGKIAIFSRPQGGEIWEKFGAIARIGFTIVDSLNDVTPEVIKNAPYLEGQFLDDEWGGSNQPMILKNGLIGVIGHKSYRTYTENNEQRLHYYGMAFAIDPKTRKFTQNKIIISNNCFPQVEPKRQDLVDVTFTSGIIRNNDGTAYIYTGLSDSHVGEALIKDPFIEYEEGIKA